MYNDTGQAAVYLLPIANYLLCGDTGQPAEYLLYCV
jgi:hypothetical protein